MDILSTAPAARIRFRAALSRSVLPVLAAALLAGCGGSHAQAPVVISSFSPAQGLAGTQVTLNGTDLGVASFISFGEGAATEYTVLSGSQIVATVPASATTGPITVNGNQNVYTTPNTFTVLPQIVGLVPASGPAGTELKITGSGFSGATRVLFTGETGAGSAFTVVGPNQINVLVGGDAATGPVQVTAGGNTATGPAFTLTN